jgi:hypothetical protein
MRYEYDEAASEKHHMDVVHEIDDAPVPAARWIEAMKRLNRIEDPLARKLIKLHEHCGSGSGQCDAGDDPIDQRRDWNCETIAVIADSFGVEYPGAPDRRPDVDR